MNTTVVVPVYRNLEVTRACLDSLAQSDLPEDTRVLVINDASPEPELVAYCQHIADSAGFALLHNADNQGFVKTANLGLQWRSDADVVLLNSDTVVAGNWLERLHSCAYHQSNIGTVTPLSNNGTICSYPHFNHSSEMPEGWSVAEMDAAAQRANPKAYQPIPTGVGFCLYIRRDCIEATGLLDEENFGLGYGEECDFCVRASALNWKHMVCLDTFVFHQGSASFADQADDRKEQADLTMRRLHPDYDDLVTQFIVDDPLAPWRHKLDRERIATRQNEAERVLTEHATYLSIIQKEARNRENTLQEHVNELTQSERAEQKKNAELEALLDASRKEFNRVDRALHEAQTVAGKMDAQIQALGAETAALQEQVGQLGSELHQRNTENAELKHTLELMKNSRSWRYTKWLRRED